MLTTEGTKVTQLNNHNLLEAITVATTIYQLRLTKKYRHTNRE